jgi:hypothetical protein
MRVLITGSRDWSDLDAIASALVGYLIDDPNAVLVSGACPSGADSMAEQLWEMWGGTVERHPANWKLGKSAGILRNNEMVDLGADVCLAFRKNYSRGTTHCANAATMAGIPTTWYTEGEE